MTKPEQSILAIDVGSSCVKLGWFPANEPCTSDKPTGNLPIAAPRLPEPTEVFRIEHRRDENLWIAEVDARLDELALPSETVCVVASVRQAVADALHRRTLAHQPWSGVTKLSRDDIPLEINV